MPFNHRTREYVFHDGSRMTEFEYMKRWILQQAKLEEQRNKIVLEERLKCIQSKEIMNELLGGTAPSMVYRRLKARNIL